jgi:hypothetical protein
LLPFLFEGKKKGVLISALSFLFHFSFLLPITVLCLYIVLGNRTLIFFAFFISSVLVSAIDIGPFNSFIEANAPAALSERTANYRKDWYVKDFRTGADSFNQQTSWHALYYMKALNWALTGLLIFLFYKRKLLALLNKRLKNVLCFTLLMWGVANILSSLPSGGRYIYIAYLSALPLIIMYVHYLYEDKMLNRLVRIATPFLLLFVIVSAREGLYTLTLNTLIGNPLVAIFANEGFPLNDLIK